MSEDLSRIDDAIQALREGRPIIVVDDENRENEGDFVAAAEKATPELIAFMITHGRGQLCMPILPEVATRLHLPPLVDHNTAPHQTAYTIPVDHISCRTGISASERRGPSRRFWTRRHGPRTWFVRDICTRWWPRKGACCAAPGTPRRPWTWHGWRGWLPPV